MSNLYTVQEENFNAYNYYQNGNKQNETELHPEQNYYQLKRSVESSPQRPIHSRIDDITQTISQYSPNRNQKAKQSLSPQKNQLNSFDRSQIETGIFNKQQSIHNPLQVVTTQARRIEELQIEVELLKQRECIQLSTEEKNQLISDLYTQIEQKNAQLERQNGIISTLERSVLDGNAKLRILEIDTEQYMIEIKQYNDELMLQNARNQSLQSNVHEFRRMLDENQSEKMQMSDQFRKQYSDAVEENLTLKQTINELQDKNNQITNQLNTALDQVIGEKAQTEILKKQIAQQQQQQQQLLLSSQNQHPQNIRKDSAIDDTINNASYNNQSFLLDDFHANTINISMTSENLSEKMKRYCAELDNFIEQFLESKKYRVRSKQEMKFFSEMAKMIQFLKNKHLKISDEFKEQVDNMNKKTEETRAHMISTLAHVRILKQSTEITITDLEKTIDGLKKDRERNLKNIDELQKKIKDLDKEMIELKKKMNTQTLKIHELTEQSAQRQRTIDELNLNVKNLNTKIDSLSDSIVQKEQETLKKEQEYNQTIKEQNEKISQLLQKQEQQSTQIDELQTELANLQSNNEELTEGLKLLHQEKDSEKQEYEQKIQEYLSNITEQTNQITLDEEKIEELEQQIKTLCDNDQGEEVLRLNKVIKEMNVKENYLQEDIRTYKRKITSLESKNEDRQVIEDQVLQLKETNEQQYQTIDDLQKKNIELESQLNNLMDRSFTSEKELSIIKEKIPLVDEEMKSLIEIKEKNLIQINQLKTLILQMESKMLMQEKKNQEQEEELEQKQVLVQMLKVELEQIDNLHQESLLHEKAFNVKKQEEYEKSIFNLIEENKQLKIQRQTLNTSINYLNKIDNFFDNENQCYQDQKQQLQKQNKKIKVLVQELDTQIRDKQILEKRVSELEIYINLIIENSVEFNQNNEKSIQELKSALFTAKPAIQNNRSTSYNIKHNRINAPASFNGRSAQNQEYDQDKVSEQTFHINLDSTSNQADQSFNIQHNQHNYDSNEVI